MTATTSTVPPTLHRPADIGNSPTILIASMFSARRSGDGVLARYYQQRLAAIGLHVTFAGEMAESVEADATVEGADRDPNPTQEPTSDNPLPHRP